MLSGQSIFFEPNHSRDEVVSEVMEEKVSLVSLGSAPQARPEQGLVVGGDWRSVREEWRSEEKSAESSRAVAVERGTLVLLLQLRRTQPYQKRKGEVNRVEQAYCT